MSNEPEPATHDAPLRSCCAPARTGEAADKGANQATQPATAAATGRLAPTAPPGMVALPGGRFRMGADDGLGFPADGEGPVREVELDPFHIDAAAVTNAQFRRFVQETGYRSEAEGFGWSFVFHLLLPAPALRRVQQRMQGGEWWCCVEGADWSHPEGLGSSIAHRLDHPVVHVSWNDARAYAAWAGKRLPTEAEFEYAARGGLEQAVYPWGDELTPGGEHRCNIWQGEFPNVNTREDGHLGLAPARSFKPNGFGLYNVVGNAWEWTLDGWGTRWDTAEIAVNPCRPANRHNQRVIRGGSYLCHDSYCNRYRAAARTQNTADSSSGHMSFRCVWSATSNPADSVVL